MLDHNCNCAATVGLLYDNTIVGTADVCDFDKLVLRIFDDCSSDYLIKIKYCPFCGEKLEKN